LRKKSIFPTEPDEQPWKGITVCGIFPRVTHFRRERRISMDEEREKLIEEIGDLALEYDMNYVG
jgi:hypothetical protein